MTPRVNLNRGLYQLVAILVACIAGLSVVCCETHKNVAVYDRYYQASETLLDSLESQLNWMDTTDPGPVYDNYIKARSNVIIVKNKYK